MFFIQFAVCGEAGLYHNCGRGQTLLLQLEKKVSSDLQNEGIAPVWALRSRLLAGQQFEFLAAQALTEFL